MPLCNRARAMILPLFQQKQMLEHEIGLVKERELKVWAIAIVLWIYLIRSESESELEDMSLLCEDMAVRGEFMKKKNTAIEDEVWLRKRREKNFWFALVVSWGLLLSVLFKLW
ncbi:hypothetical protein M0R45_026719 [Rubus argutus]|uniref:Uncharacterized protein n=1 Tax=Rubus argutus TaxID=59490 RepID=A0AAW1X1Y3_RUBAR